MLNEKTGTENEKLRKGNTDMNGIKEKETSSTVEMRNNSK